MNKMDVYTLGLLIVIVVLLSVCLLSGCVPFTVSLKEFVMSLAKGTV